MLSLNPKLSQSQRSSGEIAKQCHTTCVSMLMKSGWTATQAASDRKGKGKAAGPNKLAQLRTTLLEELGLAEPQLLLTESDPVPEQIITLAQVSVPLEPAHLVMACVATL